MQTDLPSQHDLPRILLAEDSEDDAYFFQRAVRKSGVACSVTHARNGKAAVDLLDALHKSGEPAELLFLDLKMPVLSGFDVLEWLRSANLPMAPKVIVLSGSNDQSDRLRAIELGAADYVVKPITVADLKTQILQSLAERRPRQKEAGARN